MSKPTKEYVQSDLSFLTYLSDKALNDVFEYVKSTYEDGHSDGLNDAVDDLEEPEVNEEQIGVAYAVEAFDSCTNFEEFRAKYLEIVRLNLSYTPPLGLYKAEQHKIQFAK